MPPLSYSDKLLLPIKNVLFGGTGTKMSVLKTIAGMDLDKINMDLVESLLEWIVEGKHNYPPGENLPHTVYSQLLR